ncbi:disease resistance protein RUN1-like [Castanea sativa]|uniref:disease resistance protein RUN1-like n=1 Tax=Castanea sativa TaxID=21020 RepID=UPI003F650073
MAKDQVGSKKSHCRVVVVSGRMLCKKTGQLVLPVFYKLDPSIVRKQKEKFGIALIEHEEKFKDNKEKVEKWRTTPTKAANLSRFHYEDSYPKSHFIRGIIEKGFMEWTGIGKTTIAKAVYNRIAYRFEGSNFLDNIREHSRTNDGIIQLQETLLHDILGDRKLKVSSIHKGIKVIIDRLRLKRVLLILDDVDKSNQIDCLLEKCEWLAPGSRMIITTRDKHVLTAFGKGSLMYEVNKMGPDDAKKLFIQHAFGTNKPETTYSQLAEKIICFAYGLPLALHEWGSHLYETLCREGFKTFIDYNLPKGKEISEELHQTIELSMSSVKNSNDVLIVGIHGMGGIGKTTIVYNRIAYCFEGSSFLENIREKSRTNDGIIQLQETILHDISGSRKLKVNSTSKGINVIIDRL